MTSLGQQRHCAALIMTTYLLFRVIGNIQFPRVQNNENTNSVEHVCLCDDYIRGKLSMGFSVDGWWLKLQGIS